MEKYAQIGHFNRIRGRFNIVMRKHAVIYNHNVIATARKDNYEPVYFTMHERSHITASHHIDMTSSFSLGAFSTIAGCGTQIWTHSYFHLKTGEVVRVDGSVRIQDNCYIGSGSIICPNVVIVNGVSVGAGTNVSKSLTKQGLYVSQSLRFVEFDPDEKISSMKDKQVLPYIYKK